MPDRAIDFPGVLIAGLRGGSGKTLLTLGIIAAFTRAGQSIAPFKKGPDYIDAGWLALAAGQPCHNLDTFLLEPQAVLYSFQFHTRPGQIAVIEGNRGLYDGIDIHGKTSSAEIAKLLKLPVVLVVDCTKTSRTLAAVIGGCRGFDPDVDIQGVILNRVASSRHETNLRNNIEHYCRIPVVGAVPKLDEQYFPERHMGLVPTPEHDLALRAVHAVADMADTYLDMEAIKKIACNAKTESLPAKRPLSIPGCAAPVASDESLPKIGVIRDSAFQFYYPENIQALADLGAQPVLIDACHAEWPPDLDGLYIGGGFPETHADVLCRNVEFRNALKKQAEKGLPVYAECGGLMYLGEGIIVEGKKYAMTGILPVVFSLARRPQGLGYTQLTVERENPYYEVGMEIRGHEFRYSQVVEWRGRKDQMVFGMQRGVGFMDGKDGICSGNVLGTYTHIHAWGVPSWARSVISNAKAYQIRKI